MSRGKGHDPRNDDPTEESADQPIGLPCPDFHLAKGKVKAARCQTSKPVISTPTAGFGSIPPFSLSSMGWQFVCCQRTPGTVLTQVNCCRILQLLLNSRENTTRMSDEDFRIVD